MLPTGALEENIELEGAVKGLLHTIERCAVVNFIGELQDERRVWRSLSLILLVRCKPCLGVGEHALKEHL